MQKLLVLFPIILLCNCSLDESKFYMPAEWEPHDAVWFGWEAYSTQYHSAVANVINKLTPHVEVRIAASSDSLLLTAKKYLLQQHVDTSRVKFYTIPGDRYWIRDHGSTFLVNKRGELGVADFDWNRNGYPEWLAYIHDNNRDSIQKYLSLRKSSTRLTGSVDSMMAVTQDARILKANIVHEGGAIEVNGKGTLILCEATILKRNPSRTKIEIENECKRVLGVSHVIWVKKGLAEDPLSKGARIITGKYVSGWGTGGHTDEFVRFANANTILLAWVDDTEKDTNPVNKINWERMNENLSILEKATDQDGKPFKIIKMPLPDLIVKKIIIKENVNLDESLDLMPEMFKTSEAPELGDTLLRVAAASYLNFLITNGLVIVPTYTQAGSSEEKEGKVKQIFESQFPDREIFFVNVMPQNWDGGGIHCSTQQQPKR